MRIGLAGRRRAGTAAVLASALLALTSGGVVRGDVTLSGSVRVSPLIVSLALSTATARIGETVQAQVTVANAGRATVRNIQVEVRADPIGLRVKPSTATIGQLKPGKSTVLKWSLCGSVAGTYVVLARAIQGGVAIDSPASILTIQSGGRRACS